MNVYSIGEFMNRHESMLNIVAGSDVSVLLLGESGSGKEVAARYIHAHSSRAGGPFIALNCGAIAQGLVESILEGHRKGAFTGAAGERLGVAGEVARVFFFLLQFPEFDFAGGHADYFVEVHKGHRIAPSRGHDVAGLVGVGGGFVRFHNG